MMTLEEAIDHCEEVAKKECGECAEEHLQLAKWLKELKERRTIDWDKAPSQVARDIARIVENEQDMRIQPKRGKWIRISKFPDRVEAYWVTCSACDMRIFGGGKFCPNCGADMRKTT